MKKIVLALALIALMAAGCNKGVIKDQHGNPVKDDKPFAKNDGFYSGTLSVTGYIENPNPEQTNFVFNETSSDLIYVFLGLDKGNALTGQNKIAIGCYQKDQKRIYYETLTEKENVKGEIKGDDLDMLLKSTPENRIQLRLTRDVYKGSAPEPKCGSRFRDIDVL
jgi:hypothetical protein